MVDCAIGEFEQWVLKSLEGQNEEGRIIRIRPLHFDQEVTVLSASLFKMPVNLLSEVDVPEILPTRRKRFDVGSCQFGGQTLPASTEL